MAVPESYRWVSLNELYLGCTQGEYWLEAPILGPISSSQFRGLGVPTYQQVESKST